VLWAPTSRELAVRSGSPVRVTPDATVTRDDTREAQ
jgi:hypothetical protein